MLMPLTTVSSPTPYDEISRRVFCGDALCFTAGGDALINAAQALCREVFATKTPTQAHRLYDREEFFSRAATLQQTFNSAPYKALFADWLRQIGINTTPLCWDMLGLRIAPPIATHGGGWRSSIGAHRDTWGTAIQSQINWWAPIWRLANGRTMAFFPDYWQHPLANTTAEWSFEKYLTVRKQTPAGHAVSYPSAPRALEQPITPPALVNMEVGQVLAFSSAHLHASVPNRTALTRFSLEIRTIPKDCVQQDNGAPNVDCASAPPLYRLFRRIADNQKLTD